jgi:predicted amidohydrolase YtcJ
MAVGLLAAAVIVGQLFLTRASAAPDCVAADLILTNGRLLTMDADRVAEAMAIRDGRILAVGDANTIAACGTASTRVIDLAGRMALPGLIDTHTHALSWAKGILRNQVETGYPSVRSVADIVDRVRQRAAEITAEQWIVGSGWDDAKLTDRRYVSRSDLDPASPEHPVYLVHVSGHLAVANTSALRLAGVTRDTKDPQGGVIERGATGEPTGVLKDTAMNLVERLLPADPPDLASRAARLVSERALEAGLTTIHDIYLSPDDLRGYQVADREGWLRLRVHLVPGVASVGDAERLASQGVHTGFGNNRLKYGGVKMFADGGMGARTIAIYDPPVAGEPGNLGLLIWKTDEMQKAHLILAAAGWQLITHAIGDRAIDQVLDSYQATQKALGLSDARFRIAHGGIATPAVQKRLAALKVGVDGNPAFVYWIGSWFRKYGAARVRWSYPGKSFVENAIVVGGASDVPVTPISPWWGIRAAVTRKELETGEVLAPEERLTAEQALRFYTRNAAWLGFEENHLGALRPGLLADVIVVDRDLLSAEPDTLSDVKVVMTFVGGELVYARQDAGRSPQQAR